MNSNNPVNELNKILADTFGTKTKGMIARAPMWGHADNCWIITGEHAAKAAILLAGRFGAKMSVVKNEVLGTVATLEWAA